MDLGFFEAQHAREIARTTRRLRDARTPVGRLPSRVVPDAQPFWIGKADTSLVYTEQPLTTQSVSVTMWAFDGSTDEVAGTETVDAYDWLGNGCLKGEPLWLYRRPWATGFRWYFIGTWSAIIIKGTISGRSGTTPGSGTVDWFEIDDSGVLADTGENVTVLNLAAEATDPDAYLQAKKVRGIWLVDFEECVSS